MARGAKPAKVKVGTKRLVARKVPAKKGSDVAELEQRLAEALEQQEATSKILRVISQSPTDVLPVFDTIARNAVSKSTPPMAQLILKRAAPSAATRGDAMSSIRQGYRFHQRTAFQFLRPPELPDPEADRLRPRPVVRPRGGRRRGGPAGRPPVDRGDRRLSRRCPIRNQEVRRGLVYYPLGILVEPAAPCQPLPRGANVSCKLVGPYFVNRVSPLGSRFTLHVFSL